MTEAEFFERVGNAIPLHTDIDKWLCEDWDCNQCVMYRKSSQRSCIIFDEEAMKKVQNVKDYDFAIEWYSNNIPKYKLNDLFGN
jgi:hypothetical protein